MLSKKITPYVNYYKSFYLVFIFLLTFCKAIGLSGDNYLYRYTFIISLFFWMIKIVNDQWKKKEIISLVLLLVLSVISYFITKQETLLLSFFIFSGIKGVSLKKIFTIMYITRIVGFFSVVISAHLGLIPNKLLLFWRNGYFIERYGYGFDHPNLLHSSLTLIVILFIYISYEKYNLFHMLVLFVINMIVYHFSGSRTGFLSITLLLLLTFLTQRSKWFSRFIKRITINIQFFLFGISIIISIFFVGTPLFEKIDNIFSGRLYYASEQLKYIPKLFGRGFANTYILFDNSYVMLLSMYGIVVTALFLLAYYWSAKKIIEFDNNKIVLLFFMISIICFTESFMVNALMNFTILFFAKIFFNELDEIKRK